MPDDGDHGRWLSYQELGEVLGCTANAARMHAVRRNWPRRSPNRVGDCARVLVPDEVVVQPRVTHDSARYDAPSDAHSNSDDPPHVRATNDAHEVLRMVRETVETLITPLREQLDRERERGDRERDRADQAERRVAELLAEQRAQRETQQRRRWWQLRRRANESAS
jgi:hypothetical protein